MLFVDEDEVSTQNSRTLRSRTKHPTAAQKEKLVQEIENNKLVMIGGYQGPNGTEIKKKAWERVSKILNDMRPSGSNPRGPQQWNKVWRDLVRNAKKKNTEKKRDFGQTGGGPPKVPPLSTLIKRILELVSTQAHGASKVPKGTITKSRETPANARYEISRSLAKDPTAGPSRTSIRSSTLSTGKSDSSESTEMREQEKSIKEPDGLYELKLIEQDKLLQNSQAAPQSTLSGSLQQSEPQIFPLSLTRPSPEMRNILTTECTERHNPTEAHASNSNWDIEKAKLLKQLKKKDEELQIKDVEINRVKADNEFLKTEFTAMRVMAHSLLNKLK